MYCKNLIELLFSKIVALLCQLLLSKSINPISIMNHYSVLNVSRTPLSDLWLLICERAPREALLPVFQVFSLLVYAWVSSTTSASAMGFPCISEGLSYLFLNVQGDIHFYFWLCTTCVYNSILCHTFLIKCFFLLITPHLLIHHFGISINDQVFYLKWIVTK